MTNPLAKHFRQPSMYISLPSEGKHYPDGTLVVPPEGEIPVFPMTALDEISYRSPDALFNGAATVEVIKSCIPAIKDPWAMPATDFDTALIAIRMATYGNTLDITTTCPHCGEESEFEVDLSVILSQIEAPDYTKPLVIGDLELFFKPLAYKEIHQNQMLQFEEQRLLQTIPAADMPDEKKIEMVNSTLKKLSAMSLTALAHSIMMVKDGDTVVSDANHIAEFVKNADRATFNKIRDFIVKIKTDTELKPLKITCQNDECKKEYEAPFSMDSANFFGPDS